MSLLFITVGIGWLIWSLLVYQRGQTPGKQLLGMYVMRDHGGRAGGRDMVPREMVIKWCGVSALTLMTAGQFGIVAALWCIWDKERQCLWDKVLGTTVAHSPRRFRPLTSPPGMRRPTSATATASATDG